MYDIRQFKPVLYTLLILGVSGFALAAQSPGIWVLAVSGILVNAWLVKTGRFQPLPRWLANFITLFSLLVVSVQFRSTSAVLVIGQFLILLQLIKLFEQRANRDYAQLLVLSLLLMVASAINTASLLFAVVFAAFLFVALYCCLLFHLKTETDHAKASLPAPLLRGHPLGLRQDQRHLARSMRRLTALVAVVSVATAVVVFLLFPRGTGAGVLGQLQVPGPPLTGFNEQVNFQDVSKITQNQQVIAYVKVWRNDEPVQGTETLLLRGVTQDLYDPRARLWRRSDPQKAEMGPVTISSGEPISFPTEPPPDGAALWRQEIILGATQTPVLFALAGPLQFSANRSLSLRFSPTDGAIRASDPINQKVEYEVVSTNTLGTRSSLEDLERRRQFLPAWDPRILAYARRRDVCGADAEGNNLADAREKLNAGTLFVPDRSLDDRIALNIERHLRSTFEYTLDLTDDAKILSTEDPIVAFLTRVKRGHCEYFASAMTALCQSLGMEARMVVGFKVDGEDYNQMTGTYVVRQSHAHAWVECLTADGWKSYDPTSGSAADAAAQQVGFFGRVRRFFDFLEYKWATSVVAYDNDNRENLIQRIETAATNVAINNTPSLPSGSPADWFNNALNNTQFWLTSSKVIIVLVVLMSLALVAAVGWYLLEWHRLRRRAARIGLESLPGPDQLRLVRQLGFYDDLMRLLARHEVTRPKHLTPQEFTETLTFLPAEAYDAVRRLTRIFYRVRFGRTELKPPQQHRLAEVVHRVEDCLSAPSGG